MHEYIVYYCKIMYMYTIKPRVRTTIQGEEWVGKEWDHTSKNGCEFSPPCPSKKKQVTGHSCERILMSNSRHVTVLKWPAKRDRGCIHSTCKCGCCAGFHSVSPFIGWCECGLGLGIYMLSASELYSGTENTQHVNWPISDYHALSECSLSEHVTPLIEHNVH